MQTFNADLAIVGAGGAGLRAAIAAAEANPQLKIALSLKYIQCVATPWPQKADQQPLLRLTTHTTTISTIPMLVVTGFENRMWSIISSITVLAKWLSLSNGVALGAVNLTVPFTFAVWRDED